MSNGPAGQDFFAASRGRGRRYPNCAANSRTRPDATSITSPQTRAEFPAYEDERDASRAGSRRTPSRASTTCWPSSRSGSRPTDAACSSPPTRPQAREYIVDVATRARRTPGGQGQVDDDRGNRAQPGADAEAGCEVVETDLGEYIVQLRREPPSHIITPAIHLSKEDIGQLFAEKLHIALHRRSPRR